MTLASDRVSDTELDVRSLQVRAWHDRSYTTGIHLLAHSLTVKLSPWPYIAIVVRPAGRIAACATRSGLPRMIQHLSSNYCYNVN